MVSESSSKAGAKMIFIRLLDHAYIFNRSNVHNIFPVNTEKLRGVNYLNQVTQAEIQGIGIPLERLQESEFLHCIKIGYLVGFYFSELIAYLYKKPSAIIGLSPLHGRQNIFKINTECRFKRLIFLKSIN
jgi:hypothetical protein